MAVDRLAARRAAQQQENTGYNSNLTQASDGGYQGYQSRRPNPYAQQDNQPYEMSDVRTPAASGDMKAFSDEIHSIEESINNFNDNVSRIGELQLQSVNATDSPATKAAASEVETLIQKTSELSSSLKRRIQNLDAQVGAPRDAKIRQQQTAFVERKFVKAIQDYQKVEYKYREKHKDRLVRQYRIVKPDATPEEINNVLENPNPGQIFSQALLHGDSNRAYQEVQARHQDIQRIEKTLAELAQLFNDMSILVSQQQETIEVIETQAAAVEHDTEAGLKHTNDAVKSAKAARKKRWICFFILILVIVIIAATIGGYFASQNKKTTA